MEVIEIFRFRHLIFDPIPYLQMSEFSFGWMLLLWMGTIFMLLVGWQYKMMAWANYVFSVTILGSFGLFEYHLDNILLVVNLLLPFFPMASVLSIDHWQKQEASVDAVPVIYYHLIVWLALGIVYFDSAIWKMNSEIWLQGLGMWLPATIPHMGAHSLQFLLDQSWLVKLMGYLALAFELCFMFLFIFPRLRLALCIIGIGLHLGILLFFPIPWFALSMISIYMLVLPYHYYEKIDDWLRLKTESIQLPNPHKKIAYLMLATFSLQICIIITFVPNAGKDPGSFSRLLGMVISPVNRFTGLGSHGLFIDGHFEDYPPSIRISYQDPAGKELFLPIIEKDGTTGTYNRGRIWTFWTWRLNGPEVLAKNRDEGIRRITAFWAFENEIDLQEAKFILYQAPVQVPTKWEANFLQQSKQKSWKEAGQINWQANQCEITWHE